MGNEQNKAYGSITITNLIERYITNTVVYYGVSATKDTCPSIWDTIRPTLDASTPFLWSKSKYFYSDGTSEESTPVISDTMVIVQSYEEYCVVMANSTSKTPSETATWSTDFPNTWKGQDYIWKRTTTKWSDGTCTYSPVTEVSKQEIIERIVDILNSADPAPNPLWTVGSWCKENEITIIDGATIMTGSVTADQIDVGSLTAHNSFKVSIQDAVVGGGRNVAYNASITHTVECTGTDFASTGSLKWQLKKAAKYTGTKINENVFNTGDTYTLSFRFQKIAGELINIGGHTSSSTISRVAIDGMNISPESVESSVGFLVQQVQDDDLTHHIAITFIATKEADDKDIYIQPNRGIVNEITYDLWDVKVEKGEVATDWTPAPEDMATATELSVLNGKIESKVSNNETGKGCSWSMTSDNFEVKTTAEGKTGGITVDSNGLTVEGTVNATAGVIGNCAIVGGYLTVPQLSALSGNMGTLTAGEIIGKDRKWSISIDGDYFINAKSFKVSHQGDLTANSGVIGNLSIAQDSLIGYSENKDSNNNKVVNYMINSQGIRAANNFYIFTGASAENMSCGLLLHGREANKKTVTFTLSEDAASIESNLVNHGGLGFDYYELTLGVPLSVSYSGITNAEFQNYDRYASAIEVTIEYSVNCSYTTSTGNVSKTFSDTTVKSFYPGTTSVDFNIYLPIEDAILLNSLDYDSYNYNIVKINETNYTGSTQQHRVELKAYNTDIELVGNLIPRTAATSKLGTGDLVSMTANKYFTEGWFQYLCVEVCGYPDGSLSGWEWKNLSYFLGALEERINKIETLLNSGISEKTAFGRLDSYSITTNKGVITAISFSD